MKNFGKTDTIARSYFSCINSLLIMGGFYVLLIWQVFFLSAHHPNWASSKTDFAEKLLFSILRCIVDSAPAKILRNSCHSVSGILCCNFVADDQDADDDEALFATVHLSEKFVFSWNNLTFSKVNYKFPMCSSQPNTQTFSESEAEYESH